MRHKIEICKSSNFVELICLTLSNIKIDYKHVKLVSFYRSQKCDIIDFVNTFDTILNNYAKNNISKYINQIIIENSNIDLYHSPNVTDLLTVCHDLITRPRSRTYIDHVFSNFCGINYIESVQCNLSDHKFFSNRRDLKRFCCVYNYLLQL